MIDRQLDVIAVGAHPDDVEIGCGGIVARLVEQGHRVGIVDLSDGEPTPGDHSPEVRMAESQRAAAVLGCEMRVTLDLPNRRLFDTFEGRLALAKQLRRYRPRLVLGLGDRTATASPDHYQARLLTEAAVFYTKLSRWEEHFDGLAPCAPPKLLYYFLAFHTLSPVECGGLVVDIGQGLEKKLQSLACYETQFAHRPEILERVRIFAQQQGRAAGFSAGEVLASPSVWGTRDLMGLLFAGAD